MSDFRNALKQSSWFLPLLLCGASAGASETEVPYPTDYRDWSHVKSMVIEDGHELFDAFGGIHHIYANEKAMEGYQGGKFADGSVIIFDLLQVERKNNAMSEGPRKALAVMHKDSTEFSETGGWGFEAFAEGDATKPTVKNNAVEACFTCHTARQNQDYVFSSLRP